MHNPRIPPVATRPARPDPTGDKHILRCHRYWSPLIARLNVAGHDRGALRKLGSQSHWGDGLQAEFLHLLRDFSHKANLPYMSGNPPDIPKGYFRQPIGSSNPLWSASKFLILLEKVSTAELCRDFRRLAAVMARVAP
jgi:hypothetical protein